MITKEQITQAAEQYNANPAKIAKLAFRLEKLPLEEQKAGLAEYKSQVGAQKEVYKAVFALLNGKFYTGKGTQDTEKQPKREKPAKSGKSSKGPSEDSSGQKAKYDIPEGVDPKKFRANARKRIAALEFKISTADEASKQSITEELEAYLKAIYL